MDRSEPSLVPEWLKGNSVGTSTGGSSHHQHHPHFSSLASDYSDSSVVSRHHRSGFSDRRSSFGNRRSLTNNREGPDRQCFERENLFNSNPYASFRRSSSFRAYESSECNNEVDHGKEHYTGGHGNSREAFDGSQRRSSVGTARIERESILRRSRSAVCNRYSENGDKKYSTDLQSPASPLISCGISNNMQKAVFEKNFPSLKAEERQGIIYSNPANVRGVIASSAALRQEQILAGESQDAPVVNGSPSSTNRPSSIIQQQSASSSLASNKSPIPSLGGLNMAEALIQNPPKPRMSQPSGDSQKIEEWELKQSRQLIPVTPSMPKNMGLSSSERFKTKSLRSTESIASGKGQSSVPSHLVNSARMSQGAKLLVLKQGRETSCVSSKINGNTAIKSGNSNNSSGTTTDGNGSSNLMSIKKKVIADQKLINLNSSINGVCLRANDTNSQPEEKKTVAQVQQNRNDFFKALRRKASENLQTISPQEVSNSPEGENNDLPNQGLQPFTPDVQDACKSFVENNIEGSDKGSNKTNKSGDNKIIETEKIQSNGFISADVRQEFKNETETSCSGYSSGVSVNVGSEEEEAAFLRSLGWEENAADGEELTEEEINAFYQEHMRRMAAKNVIKENRTLWNLRLAKTEK
eukprot:TRINITY_DN1546_c0_g1_i1.p1 TRINITY_DN1546_c0_g1~~TRINITY_DN1546_c0_g1_i1.p1  ORF type:complete len:639 (-),score=154.47 TRINITY_DN1546_c0_g1_i1:366-2282(-)